MRRRIVSRGGVAALRLLHCCEGGHQAYEVLFLVETRIRNDQFPAVAPPFPARRSSDVIAVNALR